MLFAMDNLVMVLPQGLIYILTREGQPEIHAVNAEALNQNFINDQTLRA